MIRLTITRERLSDGGHVFNGKLSSVDEHQPAVTNTLPEDIHFVTEEDANEFANELLALFRKRTNDEPIIVYAY